MNTAEILATLGRDSKLIDEAFRRLIDGTCCLGDYDRPYIEDLFHKVRAAVADHIAFEEEVFYPRIRKEEAALMRREHSKLTELLAEAEFAIRMERGLTFRVLMEKVGQTLREHTRVENHILASFDVGPAKHENLKYILDRVTSKAV